MASGRPDAKTTKRKCFSKVFPSLSLSSAGFNKPSEQFAEKGKIDILRPSKANNLFLHFFASAFVERGRNKIWKYSSEVSDGEEVFMMTLVCGKSINSIKDSEMKISFLKSESFPIDKLN